LDLKEKRKHEAGKNCIMKSFISSLDIIRMNRLRTLRWTGIVTKAWTPFCDMCSYVGANL
jgi:hypothetical protein